MRRARNSEPPPNWFYLFREVLVWIVLVRIVIIALEFYHR
jgi:hypothetical protein